ncbi:hypothetical protein NKH77_30495 [Streptomyces sp. M19]
MFSLGARCSRRWRAFAVRRGRAPLTYVSRALAARSSRRAGPGGSPSCSRRCWSRSRGGGPGGRDAREARGDHPARRQRAQAARRLPAPRALALAGLQPHPLRRLRRGPALAAAAVVLALAATGPPSAPTGGDDAPSHADDRPAGSGRPGTLGDVREADPCKLLDTRAVARLGTPSLIPDYGSFERCDILMTRDDDSVADVRLEFDTSGVEAGSQVPVTVSGAVKIASCR